MAVRTRTVIDRDFGNECLKHRSVISTFSPISTDRSFWHKRLKSPIGNFNLLAYFHRLVIVTGHEKGEGVLCGMRNFEKVHFAEFHLRNNAYYVELKLWKMLLLLSYVN